MRAFNLMNDTEYTFDAHTTALWAACYAYCSEHDLMSALFSSAQNKTFEQFAKTLPVIYGRHCVACGNYVAMKNQEVTA